MISRPPRQRVPPLRPPRTPVRDLPAVEFSRARVHAVDHKKEIIKHLSRATYRERASRVFDDWLDVVIAALTMLPAHAQSVAKTGKMAEDTPEVAKLWASLRTRYERLDFEAFSRAFGVLLDSTVDDDGESPRYRDTIGDVYMGFGNQNPGSGQFFTPWNVAQMMAQMTSTTAEEIRTRLRATIAKTPALAMLVLMRDETLGDESDDTLARCARYVPDDFRAVTVYDPCCGSGVMLLAAASVLPTWAVRAGLVRFYGQDIDVTCVKMCRINCMLYGLR